MSHATTCPRCIADVFSDMHTCPNCNADLRPGNADSVRASTWDWPTGDINRASASRDWLREATGEQQA